jgi:polyisoprenoid-binding protein YceI
VTSTPTLVPGYVVGTWKIDPTHSEVSFTVRHMMVSKVRGKFTTWDARIVTAGEPSQSSVTAEIDLSSINTGNDQRDGHLRSSDFFEVETHPTMTYRSTGVASQGDSWQVDGELSLHGVTRSVPLTLEVNGFTADPYGGMRAGFSATSEISRSDFGIDFNMAMEAGGVVVGDKISIAIEIEAVLEAD